jgi:hypothetical protein
MTKLGPLVDLVVVGEPITHFPHCQIGVDGILSRLCEYLCLL